LTDETTSLIRVVREKLTVAYLVQEDPRPLWTRIFTPVFIVTCWWTLSWARWIQC